jgi:hypothetical protein
VSWLALVFTLLASSACAADPAQEALDRGVEAQKAGRTDEAIAALTQCTALAPTNTRCAWELGWAYWSHGSWKEVVAAWETVKALDPSYPELAKWLPKAKANRDAIASIRAAGASAPATAAPRAADGDTVRLRFVGDVMMGADFPTPELPDYDGARLFEQVAPLMRDADMTFANLEGPLCDHGETTKCKPESTICYAFRTPTRYGRYVRDAGVDVASVANNHAGDFGDTCRAETQATLHKLGIAWSGPPGTIATVSAAGKRVGLIAFHTSGGTNDVNDLPTAAALVQKAKLDHDLVIVSFHGGAEGADALHVPVGHEIFHDEDRGDLREFARTVIGAGADLVIGHGPHVPRAMEVLDGHLVAYSLGNFATYGKFNLSGFMGTSLVLEVVLDAKGKLVTGKILPTRLIGKGVPEPDPDGTSIDLIRASSETDFPDTAPLIGRDGTIGAR